MITTRRRDAEIADPIYREVKPRALTSMDHAGLSEGWLLKFDLRKELPWAKKLSRREVSHGGGGVCT